MTDERVTLRKLRSKVLTNISHEAAAACELSFTELQGIVCGYYWPTDRQLTAMRRYFHLEEEA